MDIQKSKQLTREIIDCANVPYGGDFKTEGRKRLNELEQMYLFGFQNYNKDYSHVNLVVFIYNYAKLRKKLKFNNTKPNQQLITKFFKQSKNCISDFNSQDLANSIWALASLQVSDEYFIKQ